MNSIKLENVTKKFRSSSKSIFALNEVSLDIKHGILLVNIEITMDSKIFKFLFLDLLCSVRLAAERRPY